MKKLLKVILIRHFKVNYNWLCAYNSQGYINACTRYEQADIINDILKISTNTKVYSSTSYRAIESAKQIFGRLPDFIEPNLCEVPILPFINTNHKIPKIIWDIIGRIQWRLNSHKQEENYKESTIRVNKVIQSIISSNEDCYIIAHGWVLRLAIKKLIQLGFIGKKRLFIKNGFPMEYYCEGFVS